MINQIKFSTLILLVGILASCKTQKVAMEGQPTTDEGIVTSTVNLNKIKAHIKFLASDEMAGRDTPSEELNIAARYLSTQLISYGAKPVPGQKDFFQKVPMSTTFYPPKEGLIVSGDNKLKISEDFLLLKGNNGSINANSIFLNYGTKNDFSTNNVKGKIVITIAGYEGQSNPQEWFYAGREKRKRATEAGAKALIEVYSSNQIPWNLLLQYLSSPRTTMGEENKEINHIWVNTNQPKAIQSLKSNNPVSVSIDGLERKEFSTYNVVGMVEGTDPKLKDEYVIYSAHYDHIGIGIANSEGDSIYNGARDNAVGTVTVLSAAENIAKHPTKRSALFIFFTGEEKGLLGSAYYVDNPLLPLKDAFYCFNSDNAGYNDTSRVTIIGLTRTDAQPLLKKACTRFGLNAKEDSMPEQNLFDRSDNVNFAKKGIPAPTFGMGLTSFDESVTKYYHQPGDEAHTLDYDYLNKFFKSYVYACRLIANTDGSVFWKANDKYYEAGKQLYQK